MGDMYDNMVTDHCSFAVMIQWAVHFLKLALMSTLRYWTECGLPVFLLVFNQYTDTCEYMNGVGSDQIRDQGNQHFQCTEH